MTGSALLDLALLAVGLWLLAPLIRWLAGMTALVAGAAVAGRYFGVW